MEALCKTFQIDVRYVDNTGTVWCVICEFDVLAPQNSAALTV